MFFTKFSKLFFHSDTKYDIFILVCLDLRHLLCSIKPHWLWWQESICVLFLSSVYFRFSAKFSQIDSDCRTKTQTICQIVGYLCLSLGAILNITFLTFSLDRWVTLPIIANVAWSVATRGWGAWANGSRGSCWRWRRGGARRRQNNFYRCNWSYICIKFGFWKRYWRNISLHLIFLILSLKLRYIFHLN